MILVQKFELGHIYTSINHVHFMVVVRRRKKRDYVGKIPRVGAPPPPVWETPVIKKKSWVYFSFYNLSNIFGLHQKITILNKLNRHQEVGLGQTPPSSLGIF